MKRSKFTEEQITYALRQHDAGTPVGGICRQLGVSAASFYVWKKKYAHFEAGETSGTNALDGRPLSGQRTESLRVRVVFPCRLVPEEPGS